MALIKFLIIYLPFEAFLLKWLPVSDQMYLLLRQVPDFLVFGLAGMLLLGKLSSSKRILIIGGSVDVYIFLFIGWAFITIMLNPAADLLTGALNIKALLRYVLLIYILLILNPTEKQIENLIKYFWIVLLAQVVIGILQLFGGVTMRDFLAAKNVYEGIGGFTKQFTGDKFEGVNDLMATMGDTVSYAYFLLIGLVIWITKKPSKQMKHWLMILLFMLLIYFSDSKSVFLTSILVLVFYLAHLYHWKKVLLCGMFVLPVSIFFFWILIPSSLVSEIINDGDRLLVGLMNSRLGIFAYILPKVFLTYQNIIGFSPDKYFFAEYVSLNFSSVPSILVVVLPNVLEDVYWAAMYVYYGLIGFGFWLLFLFSLHKRINRFKHMDSGYTAYISLVATTLLLVAIPLNFLNQAFEARSFSFYLWLFCGLALVQRRRAIKNLSML